MKAIEHYSSVALFIMPWEVVLSFKGAGNLLSVTIQTKAVKQYFAVVLFIIPYKVVITFESMDEILKCDHSSERYWTVLSCGAVY